MNRKSISRQVFMTVEKIIHTVVRTALLSSLLILCACQSQKQKPSLSTPPHSSSLQIKIEGDGVRLQSPTAEFFLNSSGYLAASLRRDGSLLSLDEANGHGGQEVVVNGRAVSDFVLDLPQAQISDANGKLGIGKHVLVQASSKSSGLAETIDFEVYDDFPGMAILSSTLRNDTDHEISVERVSLQAHRFNATAQDSKVAPNNMWAFFGSSLQWGKDEVIPIPAKFSQENPFSVPIAVDGDAGGAGGGIPVVAFWTRNVGEAIGHIETLPLTLSIPVQTTTDHRVSASVTFTAEQQLKPRDTYATPRTFVAVYSGDYYEPLKQWSKALEREGLSQPTSHSEDYAVSWCSWGYRNNITPKQMLEVIPTLKELGIHWATLDDGWYNNYGDWQPQADRFPGDAVPEMVKQFHDQGIKAQIWWLPLAAEDGQYGEPGRKFTVSEVVKQHPDWLILDRDGKPARFTRNLAVLCPAVPEVQAYYKQLTEKFVRDWDFDGHKLDNIFAMPRCFNPKHHHKSPDDSVRAMGDVYKLIFETTRALKPNSVTQSCPCGTPPSLSWFRHMDQAVTADPISSLQVRRRIKMYKALLGPKAAVFGDHVELTKIIDPNTPKAQQLGIDFASTLGTGGVPGTKFTLDNYRSQFPYIALTPEKEAYWKKWIALYNDNMLSQGEFRDLYTFGYDVPEAYAIEKDGKMFYAFYNTPDSPSLRASTNSQRTWQGKIELRGLKAGNYKIIDYVNNKEIGSAQGPVAVMDVKFEDSLLLVAIPTNSNQLN